MGKILSRTLAALAMSAFVFPLTIRPDAVAECAPGSAPFVTSSQGGGVQPDNTNAKTSYCQAVAKNVELWKN